MHVCDTCMLAKTKFSCFTMDIHFTCWYVFDSTNQDEFDDNVIWFVVD